MPFHWYLFVFLIILYCVSSASHQHYQIYVAGEYDRRYKWFSALMIVAVLTYVAATRATRFGDTGAYIRGFWEMEPTWDNIIRTIHGTGKDKVFSVTAILMKMLLGERYQLYLGIIAGFCLMCVFFVYKKHSCNLFMTTFFFLASGEYVQWTHNGIRQFIAVSMIFAATGLLLKKRYILYIAVVLLASTFHASALVMIPALNIPIINLSVNMSIVSFGVFIVSMFTSGIYRCMFLRLYQERLLSRMNIDNKNNGVVWTSAAPLFLCYG